MSGSPENLSRKLIRQRLAGGAMQPGAEIGLRADQALLQDVLGTLVMLELEAMKADRVHVGVAVQYIDHDLLETDNLNQEEHLFLRSACRRYGIWYSPAGTGISHPLHMQRFGKPGDALIGCDSHTCAAGSLGMFAVGMGGLDVALAMMGEPFYVPMPAIWGVELTGKLCEWVSAKDVILEMLRRHGTQGASGRVIEYYGPGLDCLSAMDRHVIANMGAELGATTTVFPSDERTREFLHNVGRESDWIPLQADRGATYDVEDTIDLSALEPMIATPSSPGNVVRVRDVPKVDIYQAYLGSSANPGYRDFAIAAEIVRGRTTHERVSFDINPSSRPTYRQLLADGRMAALLDAGGRIHQPGCNGCIGMGQAPARGRPSLRTVPRNFAGRSGTAEDSVYLCSPETATASALTGRITDPRDLRLPFPEISEPGGPPAETLELVAPVESALAVATRLEKSENIVSLPELDTPAENLTATVLLTVGDDISTDTITPAGAQVLPHWANIAKVAEFTFRDVDGDYYERAVAAHTEGKRHAIVAGENYGQGSSRENAALAPRSIGLQMVLARSFSRIHWQNLINVGVVPLTFTDPADAIELAKDEAVSIEQFADAMKAGSQITAAIGTKGKTIRLDHSLSTRQIEIICAGGLIGYWQRSRSG